jgi:hypothetical protein
VDEWLSGSTAYLGCLEVREDREQELRADRVFDRRMRELTMGASAESAEAKETTEGVGEPEPSDDSDGSRMMDSVISSEAASSSSSSSSSSNSSRT